MISTVFRRICIALFACGIVASAQQFRLIVTQGGVTSTIQNGAGLTFNAPVGQSVTARVTAVYTGTAQVTIERQPELIGSTAFTSTLNSRPPLTFGPGSSFSFDIRYQPVSGSLSSAQLSLAFAESVPAAGPAAPQTTAGTVTLVLQGTSAAFGLSYVLQTDQNVISLRPGDSLAFTPTPVNTTAQAGLNVTNLGSGAGAVTGISLLSNGGGAFRLSRLPLFPITVPGGQSLQILVLYQPLSVASDTGQVQITFETGSPVTVNLEGSGSSPKFTYQLVQSNPPEAVLPGGIVTLPQVAVGQTSTALMQVTNSGNAAGTIGGINVLGAGFQIATPPVLPQTLAPNSSLTFGVNFTPSRTGTLTGTLVVNSDRFDLSGVGLGPQLTFSYDLAGATVTLDSNNTSVVFTPVMISRSAQITLNVKNTGTLAATIANIGIGQNDSPFSVSALPGLPVSLAPGAEIRVPITFTPSALGFTNGALRIDSATVALVGSGTQPPALPAYTITAPSGNVAPGPVAVSLALSTPYPVAIAGTLNLGVATSLPADPAVQFATGGAVARFVIPAGSTSAVFGSQGAQVGLQTGTVNGTLTLTPAFATQAGGVDLTPASPVTSQFRVAPAPPVLLAVQISGQSATGFTLTATGFSTTRILTSMTIELTPATGVKLASNKFTIDLQQIGAVWFRSATSQPFGGQFTITMPFTLQGAGSSAIFTSITTSVSNDIGQSNAIQSSSSQ